MNIAFLSKRCMWARGKNQEGVWFSLDCTLGQSHKAILDCITFSLIDFTPEFFVLLQVLVLHIQIEFVIVMMWLRNLKKKQRRSFVLKLFQKLRVKSLIQFLFAMSILSTLSTIQLENYKNSFFRLLNHFDHMNLLLMATNRARWLVNSLRWGFLASCLSNPLRRYSYL